MYYAGEEVQSTEPEQIAERDALGQKLTELSASTVAVLANRQSTMANGVKSKKASVVKAVAPYDSEEAEAGSEGGEERMLNGSTAETASAKESYSDASLALESGW